MSSIEGASRIRTKPHLKIQLNGRVQVVAPATSHVSCKTAEQLITKYYGSRFEFAIRFGFSYSALSVALKDDNSSWKRAGLVSEIRKILGLPSEPTQRSLKQAEWHAKRRAARAPDWIFDVGGQP